MQVETQASMVDVVVTEVTLYAMAGHTFSAGVKVHKMLKISAVAGDAEQFGGLAIPRGDAEAAAGCPRDGLQGTVRSVADR